MPSSDFGESCKFEDLKWVAGTNPQYVGVLARLISPIRISTTDPDSKE
jgi:hypothetical protein